MSKRTKARGDDEDESGSRRKPDGPLQHPDDWILKEDHEEGGFKNPNVPANVPTNFERTTLDGVLGEAVGSSSPDPAAEHQPAAVQQARASPPLAPTTIDDIGTELLCPLAGRLFQQPARRIF